MAKSLKKNAFYSFVKAFMNLAFPIISFPYATRVLLPDSIGMVNFANSIIDYFHLFAALGIATYASREAAKIRDDKQALNKFSREMLVFNFISMGIAYVLFFVAIFLIPKLSAYRAVLCVLSAKILFETIGVKWLFVAEEEYKYITLRSILFQVISLVFLFVFVRKPDDYIKYALFGMISSVGANIFNVFYSRKFINIFEKHVIELKNHIKPVFVFFGSTLTSSVYTIVDSTMLGFLASTSAVAFYAAANKLIVLVVSLTGAVLGSLLPRSAYWYENGMTEEYKSLIHKSITMALFFCMPAAIGLFVLCRPAMLVLCGEQYMSAVTAMEILSPLILTNGINAVIINVILLPQGKERFLLRIQIIQCLINIVCNYFLIAAMEVKGAALATLGSESFLFCVLLFMAKKKVCTKKVLENMLKVFMATLCMALLVRYVSSLVTSVEMQLFVGILTGGITYAAVSILLKHETALVVVNLIQKKMRKEDVHS